MELPNMFLDNATFTEKGQQAYRSTLDPVLDLFYALGASRGQDLTDLATASFEDDPILTLKAILWARDIRCGAGERDHLRNLIPALLGQSERGVAEAVIRKIPELGRFDDLMCLWGTPYEEFAAKLWILAIADKNALAAKWAPRKDKKGAKPLRNAARMTEKSWRQLVALVSDTVEQKLCAGQISEVDFGKLPSKAAQKYSKAFLRSDSARYGAYLEGLASGETKVNAGAIYPHDIIGALYSNPQLSEAQWKALPEWDFGEGTLPIIDVSGSMGQVVGNTTAMNIAISLGIYAAEHGRGDFKDVFITFSEYPSIVSLKECKSLADKVNVTRRADWGMNTNIEAVFSEILELAVSQNVPASDMPKRLLIISDMQFDSCIEGSMDTPRKMFEAAGYELPTLVFWQVNSRAGGIPITAHQSGAALVSGFSPSIIRAVMSNEVDPITAMLTILNEARYDITPAGQ
jgi:hypothetical protein